MGGAEKWEIGKSGKKKRGEEEIGKLENPEIGEGERGKAEGEIRKMGKWENLEIGRLGNWGNGNQRQNSSKKPAATILPGQRGPGGVRRSTTAQSGSFGVWSALLP